MLLDLDGVVYLGDQPVPGAADALAEVRASGTAVHFVTNNASRRAPEVVDRLRGCGVASEPSEITTSAQGAGVLLADRFPAGSSVLVLGAEALSAEVAEAGLRPARSADDRPVAVVQGFSRDVDWPGLCEATVAVRSGAVWVATNLDSTLPSPRGPLPGNGALVDAVAAGLSRRPDLVVGKPEPALFEQAVQRRGGVCPLVVGDRLDTDIEGATRAGMPSLLVLTGVTGPAELLAAPQMLRPTYLAADLSGLLTAHPVTRAFDGEPACCGGWRAWVRDAALVLDGAGDGLDALRAACAAAWAGRPPGRVEPVSPEAATVVADWR